MDRSRSLEVISNVNARRSAVRSIAWLGLSSHYCPCVIHDGHDQNQVSIRKPKMRRTPDKSKTTCKTVLTNKQFTPYRNRASGAMCGSRSPDRRKYKVIGKPTATMQRMPGRNPGMPKRAKTGTTRR